MLENPQKVKDDLVRWIQEYFKENGPDCSAVVGISGGKDSSIVAALCKEALGAERVVGVTMPNGLQSDYADSQQLIETLGIQHFKINIFGAYRALREQIEDCLPISNQTIINLPPRIRMATLYAVAQSLPNGGRVANTCNLSEDYVGYSTKFGDSAGDFSPLSYLMVHEVIQLGHALGLPANLVNKTPSDGLCGKSDEDNLGFSYNALDKYILTGTSGDKDTDVRIAQLHAHNLHKQAPMPFFFPYGGR